MSRTTTDYNKRAIKSIIKRMEEPGRPSVTIGKADIRIVLPLLKKEIGEK